jgi:hypothetical protein
MLGGVVVPVVVPDDDEVAPQPEKHTAINKRLARAKNPHFDDTRIFCTLVSSLIWTSDPLQDIAGTRRRLVTPLTSAALNRSVAEQRAEKLNHETRGEDALNAVIQQSGDTSNAVRNS